MLILNRKIDESIIIGDAIEIKILDIADGKIKIGIDAPKDVRILRKEIYDEVKAENEESLKSSVNALKILKNK